MPETFRDLVRRHRVMVIYRGQSVRECVELTDALHEAGIKLFEVTLNSEHPFDAIAALRARLGDGAPVGSGTVLSADDVSRSADAGAQFVVSPHVDESVVERAKDLGLPVIPGAFTPTEVVHATKLGADVVKLFPIAPVGPDYVRQLRGPLPDVPLMATGGVDADRARACVDAGCEAVGVGAHLLGAADGLDQVVREGRRILEATGNAQS